MRAAARKQPRHLRKPLLLATPPLRALLVRRKLTGGFFSKEIIALGILGRAAPRARLKIGVVSALAFARDVL